MTIVEMPVLSIDSVDHLADYRLRLHFSDESVRDVDFAPFLRQSSHPEIRKYLDIKKFGEFRVIDGDLMWGDYELIFPLHKLYEGEMVLSQNKWNSQLYIG
jgi:hypothetical protein